SQQSNYKPGSKNTNQHAPVTPQGRWSPGLCVIRKSYVHAWGRGPNLRGCGGSIFINSCCLHDYPVVVWYRSEVSERQNNRGEIQSSCIGKVCEVEFLWIVARLRGFGLVFELVREVEHACTGAPEPDPRGSSHAGWCRDRRYC